MEQSEKILNKNENSVVICDNNIANNNDNKNEIVQEKKAKKHFFSFLFVGKSLFRNKNK